MQLSLSLLISVDLFSPSIYTGKYSIHYFCHVRSGSGAASSYYCCQTPWLTVRCSIDFRVHPATQASFFSYTKWKFRGSTLPAMSCFFQVYRIPPIKLHESKTVSIFQPAPVMVLTDLGHFVLGQIPSLCVWMSVDFTLFLNSKFFGHLDHVKLPT